MPRTRGPRFLMPSAGQQAGRPAWADVADLGARADTNGERLPTPGTEGSAA